ncbi:unnamed protein product [Candidula unifasciata]|uniref:Uncharacterized protein n=1 Tax=Candidula unifasciata TaxID=100452 RepID=A0A8S3YKE8_9EUPU|nr:unnamed protein product [Candidula unifasciata]
MTEMSSGDSQRECDVTTIDELSKEELDALQKLGNETISSLEADIELLERKIKKFGPGALPMRNDTSSVTEMESILQKDIDTYSARLKETVRLTGVTIENISREVLELDDNHCIKQFALELLFMNRKVHLKYTLEDTWTSVGEQGGKITWFEVKFEEDINEAVGAEIAKAADNLAIHSVFSILKSFVQWQVSRDKMMKHFTEKYPENVSQQTGKERNQCLRIINKPDRPEFVLELGRKIVNSRVEADVKVEVNAPKELLEMDRKKILRAIPDMFATMVKNLGLEKAIDGLIQMVISDGQRILQTHSVPIETPPENAESVETPLGKTSQDDEEFMETPQEEI